MRSIFSVSDTGGLVEKIQVLQTGVEAMTVRLPVHTSTTKPRETPGSFKVRQDLWKLF